MLFLYNSTASIRFLKDTTSLTVDLISPGRRSRYSQTLSIKDNSGVILSPMMLIPSFLCLTLFLLFLYTLVYSHEIVKLLSLVSLMLAEDHLTGFCECYRGDCGEGILRKVGECINLKLVSDDPFGEIQKSHRKERKGRKDYCGCASRSLRTL